MKNMTAKEARKIMAEYNDKFIDTRRVSIEPQSACGECGWNGKVDWRAKGQKCPDCGAQLT